MANRVGQQFGNYRLVRLLGQSDWASVYVGEHLSLHTQVAIKLFTLPLTGDDVGHFHTEVSVLARLAQPSLLRVLEGGLEDDRPFLVMDYAPGGSLRAPHPRGAIVQAPVMFSYLETLVVALRYLEEHHLFHGDLKPENMLLERTGALVLSDVNLPVLTQKRHSLMHQQEISSITYLAPEQLQGQTSPASDQYALGVVVYEWLSGDVPFHGSLQKLSQQHLSFSPLPLRGKNPAISSYVEDVVLKALAKNPGQRFASVQAFVEELEQACQGTQSIDEGLPPGAPPRPSLTAAVEPSLPAQDAAAPGTILSTYRGHTHFVQAAVWSPDSTRIASNSTLMVEVWDTSSGSLLLTYRSHASGVTAVAWSPSGKYLASASADQTVHVWSGGAVGTICIYQDHTTRVLAVGWSPDGRRIASADNTGMVHVWDAATGATVFIYRGHGGSLLNRVNAVGWSPDGKHIASASDDGSVQVWQAP
jgi:serine/threonine protein kinase